MRNTGSYIFARIAGLLLVSVLAIVYAVQTPAIQTRIARRAAAAITEALDGKVYCRELKIMPSGALMMSDILITDSAPCSEDAYGNPVTPVDTVLTARRLTATFTLAGLFRHEGLHMGRVSLEDAFFHLVIEPNEYGTNITRIFGLLPEQDSTVHKGKVFDLQKFSAGSIHFKMTNLVVPGHAGSRQCGIDFNDLDLVADIQGRRLSFADGTFKGSVPSVSLKEKSGYILDRLSADVVVGPGKTVISDIEIDDPWSHVRARSFSMNYRDARSFADFEESVRMELDLRRSRLSMMTTMYFSGAFQGSEALLDLQAGRVTGYVNDLALENIVFTDLSGGVSGVLSGRMTGLPDFENMLLEAKLDKCRFSFSGLDSMVRTLLPGTVTPLGDLAPGASFVLNASASGPINRLEVNAGLSSSIGDADVSGELRNIADSRRPVVISSSLATRSLDIGELTGKKDFGLLTSDARIRATLFPDNPEIFVDSLDIRSFNAFGYRYHAIGARASLIDWRARVNINSSDPNIRLKAAALADLKPKSDTRQLVIDVNMEDLDLHAINVDERTVSKVSAGISANLTQDGNYINGSAAVHGLMLENAAGRKEIGDIQLDAYNFAAEQCFRMDAPFARISISAGGPPAKFLEDLQQLTLRRELPAIYADSTSCTETANFHLDIMMHDSQNLLSFIAPGLYIADSTSLCLEVLDNGEMLASLNSERIAFQSNYLKDLDLSIDNMGESLNMSVRGSTMRFGGIPVLSPDIDALAMDNRIQFNLSFDDFGAIGGAGKFSVEATMQRDSTNTFILNAHPLESYVGTGQGMWTFGESDIVFHGKDFHISNLQISNGEQSISADGGFSAAENDTLSLKVHMLDLSLLNNILDNGMGIRGKANGSASLHTGPDRNPGMLLDLRLDSLGIGGVDAGMISVSSVYENGNDDIEIYLRNKIEGKDVLFAKGMFFPAERRLDMNASLDGFPVQIAGALMPEIFSEVSGSISGDLSLRHSAGAFSTRSDNMTLNSVTLTPRMTGVRYVIDGPFSIGEDGIQFSTLAVHDSDGGSGNLSGKLGFYNLKDFTLDAGLDFDNLKFIDIIQSGHGVYGLVRASGHAGIKGPLNSLEIDADLSTSGPGNIHIPTFGSATGTTSNLLTFTQKEVVLDDYDLMLDELSRTRKKPSDLKIRARVGIMPTVRAYVEMDKSSGNMASFTAQGNLAVNLRPSQDVFDITGDLTVNEGEYQFSIPGILSKAFTIQQGSSIRFVGTLPDTQLDIDAVYSQKASLDALIPDLSEGLKRTVNCGINISDRLRNPRLSFSIDIPDLNPTARSQVESALSTDDKVQKQFVALLVLGSFMPDESSGIIDSNDILLSNVTGFMAGQLNSILQKLEIPVDIGLDYHSNSTTGSNIFDVAISTQLFNNRVIVGGSVANRGYDNTAGASQADVIGDLDIQIKLDPEGRYRFNMFSHSADEYSSILDLSQRNGVGISFQKEYYKFSDFLRSIFDSEKDSTSRATIRPKEMNTIIIVDDDKQE